MNEREDIRFQILAILLDQPAYTANQEVLLAKLHKLGYMLDRAKIRVELAWLANVDTIVVKQPGGVWIATLDEAGDEHLRGYALIPGIRPPRPGEGFN